MVIALPIHRVIVFASALMIGGVVWAEPVPPWNEADVDELIAAGRLEEALERCDQQLDLLSTVGYTDRLIDCGIRAGMQRKKILIRMDADTEAILDTVTLTAELSVHADATGSIPLCELGFKYGPELIPLMQGNTKLGIGWSLMESSAPIDRSSGRELYLEGIGDIFEALSQRADRRVDHPGTINMVQGAINLLSEAKRTFSDSEQRMLLSMRYLELFDVVDRLAASTGYFDAWGDASESSDGLLLDSVFGGLIYGWLEDEEPNELVIDSVTRWLESAPKPGGNHFWGLLDGARSLLRAANQSDPPIPGTERLALAFLDHCEMHPFFSAGTSRALRYLDKSRTMVALAKSRAAGGARPDGSRRDSDIDPDPPFDQNVPTEGKPLVSVDAPPIEMSPGLPRAVERVMDRLDRDDVNVEMVDDRSSETTSAERERSLGRVLLMGSALLGGFVVLVACLRRGVSGP